MNDFRFRAWDTRDKCMLDWLAICQTAFNRGDISLMYDLLTKPQEHIILMQFTGIKDRSGRRIYEGDIIRYQWNGMEAEYYVVKDIYWAHNEFPNGKLPSIAEVVGDVYRNPELLPMTVRGKAM